jgi:hypothetical protein
MKLFGEYWDELKLGKASLAAEDAEGAQRKAMTSSLRPLYADIASAALNLSLL